MSEASWSEDYALDGNALAAELDAVFAAEITNARRVCQSCGTDSAIGAHRAYRGAGIVLRCPVCRDLAMQVVEQRTQTRVWLAGEWSFQTPDR
jgi:Family of unknown function (DUF6510)